MTVACDHAAPGRFDAVLGGQRGTGTAGTVLAAQWCDRARADLQARDRDLYMNSVAGDIELVRAHDLASHPVLAELARRLPARLGRMVATDLAVETGMLAGILPCPRLPDQADWHATPFLVSATDTLLRMDDVAPEDVWAHALDAYEDGLRNAAQELLPRPDFRRALGPFAERVQDTHGPGIWDWLGESGDRSADVVLRAFQESVGCVHTAEHAREALADAVEWLRDGKAVFRLNAS